MDKLHSIQSAAEFLGGISPWTVRAWLSRGKLSRVKIGSRTMVREKELTKLIRTQNAKTIRQGQQPKCEGSL